MVSQVEPLALYPGVFFLGERGGTQLALVAEQAVPAVALQQVEGVGEQDLQVVQLARTGVVLENNLAVRAFEHAADRVFKV